MSSYLVDSQKIILKKLTSLIKSKNEWLSLQTLNNIECNNQL